MTTTEKEFHLEKHTEKQRETLANTIQKRKWISLWVGLEELGKTISWWSEKPTKNNQNEYQISEELGQYEKKLAKGRPPFSST